MSIKCGVAALRCDLAMMPTVEIRGASLTLDCLFESGGNRILDHAFHIGHHFQSFLNPREYVSQGSPRSHEGHEEEVICILLRVLRAFVAKDVAIGKSARLSRRFQFEIANSLAPAP